MTTKSLGLYVHIPFCIRKCNYCDFCSFPIDCIGWKEKYISALCREIDSYRGRDIRLDSIFFGGGTPSLLSPDDMRVILDHVNNSFIVSPDTEFTLEANPKTLDEEKLRAFISCGVNRLSLGLQSIHKNEQKILGRIHNLRDFEESFLLARKLGIDNINVDLMYGIPEQTIQSFKETVEKVLSLSPEHISLYGLILEEGTPFYSMRDQLTIPSEDTECDMYYLAADYLARYGYIHYEVSNYAKAGYACRHNLKYWRNEEYIGVGLSAYSYFDGARFGNTSSIEEYLSEKEIKYISKDVIDSGSQAYEFVMLGLRLREGISLAEYESLFGKNFLVGREEKIKLFCDNQLMRLSNGRLSLTEQGFYVSNSILTELI